MMPDEIEKLARDRKPLPQYSTLPDACYYQTIRGLWDGVRSGRINKDEARAEKKRMLRQYAEFRAAYENCCAVYRAQQDRIRCIGTLRTQLHRAVSTEDKLRIALRCISLMTGENVTEKMEVNKLESTKPKDTGTEKP